MSDNPRRQNIYDAIPWLVPLLAFIGTLIVMYVTRR